MYVRRRKRRTAPPSPAEIATKQLPQPTVTITSPVYDEIRDSQDYQELDYQPNDVYNRPNDESDDPTTFKPYEKLDKSRATTNPYERLDKSTMKNII